MQVCRESKVVVLGSPRSAWDSPRSRSRPSSCGSHPSRFRFSLPKSSRIDLDSRRLGGGSNSRDAGSQAFCVLCYSVLPAFRALGAAGMNLSLKELSGFLLLSGSGGRPVLGTQGQGCRQTWWDVPATITLRASIGRLPKAARARVGEVVASLLV